MTIKIRTLKIISLLIFITLFLGVTPAVGQDVSIEKIQVGEKGQDPEGKNMLVFSGGHEFPITVWVAGRGCEAKSDKKGYAIEPCFEERYFEIASEEYRDHAYRVWLRTKDATAENACVTLKLKAAGTDCSLSEARVDFRILRSHKPKIRVVSPPPRVLPGSVTIDFSSGLEEKEEEISALRIKGRLSGGELRADKDFEAGDSFTLEPGHYSIDWEAWNKWGYQKTGTYDFVVEDAYKRAEGRVEVRCQREAYVGEEFPVYLNRSYTDEEKATFLFFEDGEEIGSLRYSDNPRRRVKMLSFDTPGRKEITVELRRSMSDTVLNEETFSVEILPFEDREAIISRDRAILSPQNNPDSAIVALCAEDKKGELPKGFRDEPYILDISSALGESPQAGTVYHIILKDWNHPSHLSNRTLVYDPQNSNSLRTEYLFDTSSNKDFYIGVIQEGKPSVYQCYRAYISPRFDTADKEETAGQEKGWCSRILDLLR